MANVIKALRTLKGISQDEISKRMKIGISTYNTKENNPDLFTVAEAKKIVEILDAPYSIFFEKEVNLKVTV
ncbi:helix-turn-helix transcriptional regulator [Clostridium cochlearium]|uniref:helix-turn-helix transcriptional regulator n=1 Tax=Clostridium cochlearium TaxID=1494 RepID=UPI001459E3B6|nr:helix-turn-helix transcriptional regulator [Clostridium cochlearium]NME95320.1 helix-turn-helix transcriptional regulator [Clostridium cochlearium]